MRQAPTFAAMLLSALLFSDCRTGFESFASDEDAGVRPGSARTLGISQSQGQAASPSLILDNNDQPLVAWEDSSSGTTQIFVRHYDGERWKELGGSASGGGVSDSAGQSEAPSLALDSGGRPAVAWHDDTAGQWEIYFKRFNGEAWVELDGSASSGGVSHTPDNSGYPVLKLDSSDHPVVAWHESIDGNSEIYLRVHDGTGWVELARSATSGGVSRTAGASWYVALDLDSAGQPVVAWHDHQAGTAEILLRAFDGIAWQQLAGSAQASGLSATPGDSYNPVLAIDAQDRPLVAWGDDSSGTWQIDLRRYSPPSWDELQGSATGGGISASPAESWFADLALDATGLPTVVWHDSSNGNWEIYLRRYDGQSWQSLGGSGSGGGLSANDGGSWLPSLALDSRGRPVVAWQDGSSGRMQIYLRRWDGAAWSETGV
ncbi:MAG: hypothetical protein ABIJ09_06435 [Pseudomonadota bacterium]